MLIAILIVSTVVFCFLWLAMKGENYELKKENNIYSQGVVTRDIDIMNYQKKVVELQREIRDLSLQKNVADQDRGILRKII